MSITLTAGALFGLAAIISASAQLLWAARRKK
jgi:hypothetical protein